MLRFRFYTAAIVRGGDAVFLLLVLGFGGAGLYEFMRAALPADRGAQRALGIVLGLFILCCVFAESRPQPAQFGNGSYLILGGCIISFVALFVQSVLSAREVTDTVSRMAVTLFGIFYVSLFFSYLLLLYAENSGPMLIMFLLCVTWGVTLRPILSAPGKAGIRSARASVRRRPLKALPADCWAAWQRR